jgi:lipopolysaccharide export LptBFGC system permease protein LptF
MVEINIPSQTTLVNDKINSIKTNKDKSERLEFYSAQNEVLLTYVRKILFILYYIVFVLMAVGLFMKREQFSLIFVVFMFMFFGFFPYIVDYVAIYAYYRWLV